MKNYFWIWYNLIIWPKILNLSKNILITGIKGLIGKNTSKNLMDKGHKIIGIDISKSHTDNKLDYYQCNLVSQIDTDKVLKKIFS